MMDDEEFEQIDCTNLTQKETEDLIQEKLRAAEKNKSTSVICGIEDDLVQEIEEEDLDETSAFASQSDDNLCSKLNDAKEKFIEG